MLANDSLDSDLTLRTHEWHSQRAPSRIRPSLSPKPSVTPFYQDSNPTPLNYGRAHGPRAPSNGSLVHEGPHRVTLMGDALAAGFARAVPRERAFL